MNLHDPNRPRSTEEIFLVVNGKPVSPAPRLHIRMVSPGQCEITAFVLTGGRTSAMLQCTVEHEFIHTILAEYEADPEGWLTSYMHWQYNEPERRIKVAVNTDDLFNELFGDL